MITVFSIFSALALGYRVYRYRREIARGEWALVAVVAVNFLAVILQNSFENGRFRLCFAEDRYVLQACSLLFPWGVWMILRFRWISLLLPGAVAALVIFQSVMTVKSHFPVGRRSAFIAAADWAVGRIRADYRGPASDEKKFFSLRTYHRQNRPVVHGHTARVGYLLNGRDEEMKKFGKVDLPDYWVTGGHDENFPAIRGRYELLDAKEFGKRKFEIYRRKRR